jgi:hypothetical protein
MTEETPTLTIRRWARHAGGPFAGPVFMFDGSLPRDLHNVTAVTPAGSAERARELIACGADCVLLGDAAMRDSALVPALSAALGEGKVGVWVPARRMSVSWSLDYECNADFRCIAPSRVTPAWEIVSSSGQGTGTDAAWWAGQMLERGAAMALMAVDMDDAGLNICAGLTERFASQLWFTPLHDLEADLTPWVEYGHAANLVLPATGRYDEAAVAALRDRFGLPLRTAA